MEQLDYIIVGQGLAGSLLDFSFRKNGLHGVVIDNGHKNAASKVAAGMINPITGRKYVKSWMIDELLPRAIEIYGQLSKLVGVELFAERNIVRALYSRAEENEWEIKTTLEQTKKFRVDKPVLNEYSKFIKPSLSYGELTKGYHVHVPVIIRAYRAFLEKYKFIVETQFNHSKLKIENDGFVYDLVKAKQVFFCDGYKVNQNPFFNDINHQPSKGEALIIKVQDFEPNKILKQKLNFVPFGQGVFWVGAGYEWEFENEKPTKGERDRIEKILKDNLSKPYKVIDHIAAVRPTVIDRRPYIGAHKIHSNMFLFNGFGTKGASLIPYWSEHLMRHICFKEPLASEVFPYR